MCSSDLKTPVACVYSLEKGITESLERYRKITSTLTEAIYRVRTNIIGALGDRVFCYRRMTNSAIERDRKASVTRAHADTAVRL